MAKILGTKNVKRALGWAKYALKRAVRVHRTAPVRPIDGKRGNAIVREAIRSGKPFLAGRVGSVELKTYLHVNGVIYDRHIKQRLERWAGIYPQNFRTLESFAQLIEDSVRQVDVLAVFGWNNESRIVDLLHRNANVVPPKTLEPYFYPGEGWWHELGGKRLLIVNSIASELRTRITEETLMHLWPSEKGKVRSIMPREIQVIDTPYGWDRSVHCRFATYKELLDDLKAQVQQVDFDIALVACGGYGLPLGAWMKLNGKQVIHLGGVIQVWGGFKGVRFETMIPWKHVVNEHWIPYPETKIPQDRTHAEGHYWQRV